VIYLASRSPRRQELLRQIGVGFSVLDLPDVDETRLEPETPRQYVLRLAREKATAGVAEVRRLGLVPRPVLGADTTVCIGAEIFGKPGSARDAADMLRRLSGITHLVLTGVCIADVRRASVAINITEVDFAALDAETVERYVATGEPLDKAGAYAAQGLGAMFIRAIRGSHSGVVGLPLFETMQLLREFGISESIHG
jgi:septum formation protein